MKGRAARKKGLRLGLGLLALLICAVVGYALYRWLPGMRPTPDEGLTVYFIDVNQGDAALITCGGETLMIDGGGSGASQIVYSFLHKRMGLERLDYVISTHPHADHVGGLSAALNACSVGVVYSPVTEVEGDFKPFASFLKYVQKQGKTLTVPRVGDSFALGEARVEFLGPLRLSQNMNDNSLVVMVTYGETSFLFTGDAEYDEEQDLLASDANLRANVLKVGHHGSDVSSCEAFLKAVSPSLAVVSLGRDNTYGHPGAAAMARLRAVGAEVLRTDECGDIVVRSDGTDISVDTERTPPPATAAPSPSATPELTPEPTPEPVTETPLAMPERTPEPATGETNPTLTPASAPVGAGVPTAPEEPMYIGNRNSHKFHEPDCSSVRDMAEKNKVPLYSREEAVSQGYTPCGRCRP